MGVSVPALKSPLPHTYTPHTHTLPQLPTEVIALEFKRNSSCRIYKSLLNLTDCFVHSEPAYLPLKQRALGLSMVLCDLSATNSLAFALFLLLCFSFALDSVTHSFPVMQGKGLHISPFQRPTLLLKLFLIFKGNLQKVKCPCSCSSISMYHPLILSHHLPDTDSCQCWIQI